MFGTKKAGVDLSKINSCVGPGNIIKGEFGFCGSLKFCGELNGSLIGRQGSTKPEYTVAIIEGKIDGEKIEADHVIVIGQVNVKEILAHRTLIICRTARLSATEIKYAEMSVEQGAKVVGQMIQLTDEVEVKDE